MKIRIEFDQVRSQQRPRFVRKTGVAFKPAADKRYEESLREEADYIVGETEGWPLNALYMVTIAVTLPLKRYSMMDLDNIAKSVLDGLTGAVWDDDNQVVELHLTKEVGDEHLEVEVYTVEGS